MSMPDLITVECPRCKSTDPAVRNGWQAAGSSRVVICPHMWHRPRGSGREHLGPGAQFAYALTDRLHSRGLLADTPDDKIASRVLVSIAAVFGDGGLDRIDDRIRAAEGAAPDRKALAADIADRLLMAVLTGRLADRLPLHLGMVAEIAADAALAATQAAPAPAEPVTTAVPPCPACGARVRHANTGRCGRCGADPDPSNWKRA